MTFISLRLPLIALAGALLLSPTLATAEDQPGPKAAPADEHPTITDTERADAKAIFASQCSWCHGSYGLTAETGPRLAGTKMTRQEVEDRIRNGKKGAMPSFRRFLDDDQIALMAKYVKSLQAPD